MAAALLKKEYPESGLVRPARPPASSAPKGLRKIEPVVDCRDCDNGQQGVQRAAHPPSRPRDAWDDYLDVRFCREGRLICEHGDRGVYLADCYNGLPKHSRATNKALRAIA